jgi:hypothetical protein
MTELKSTDPFHNWDYKVLRLTLSIILVLGAIGFIAFTVIHLIYFIKSLL